MGGPLSVLRVRLVRFLAATAAAAAVFLGASAWLDSLAFDRVAIIEGEYWRLATAHLTHLDNTHALMNAVGVGLVTTVLLDFLRPARLLASVVTIAGTISGVSVLLVAESTYAGFSGILYGLAAMAVFGLATRSPWLAVIVAVALVAGIITAFFGWSRPWTADVAVHTHVCGMATGAAIGWSRRLKRLAEGGTNASPTCGLRRSPARDGTTPPDDSLARRPAPAPTAPGLCALHRHFVPMRRRLRGPSPTGARPPRRPRDPRQRGIAPWCSRS